MSDRSRPDIGKRSAAHLHVFDDKLQYPPKPDYAELSHGRVRFSAHFTGSTTLEAEASTVVVQVAKAKKRGKATVCDLKYLKHEVVVSCFLP